MNKYWLSVLLFIIIFGGLWSTYDFFRAGSSKLAEATFYKDNNIELKVILIHENIPLHYVGNSYSVACQSKNTISPAPNDAYELKTFHMNDNWNLVPGAYLGNGKGDNQDQVLQDLVSEAKRLHLVKDEMTVVALGHTGISTSFDGCRSFISWNLKENIPKDLVIKTTPEYESCLVEQKKDAEMNYPSYRDCADLKFVGTNAPIFENITGSDDGSLSFSVSSGAFADGQTLDFETKDFGKNWQIRP